MNLNVYTGIVITTFYLHCHKMCVLKSENKLVSLCSMLEVKFLLDIIR